MALAASAAVASPWKDIFSHFGDIFGDAFQGAGHLWQWRPSPQRAVRKGADLRIKVKVTLKDIMNGVDKKLKLPRWAGLRGMQGHRSQGRYSLPHLFHLPRLRPCHPCAADVPRGYGEPERVS